MSLLQISSRSWLLIPILQTFWQHILSPSMMLMVVLDDQIHNSESIFFAKIDTHRRLPCVLMTILQVRYQTQLPVMLKYWKFLKNVFSAKEIAR